MCCRVTSTLCSSTVTENKMSHTDMTVFPHLLRATGDLLFEREDDDDGDSEVSLKVMVPSLSFHKVWF